MSIRGSLAAGLGRWEVQAALLALLVLSLHWDALFHLARADQLVYLHRTAWYSGLRELTIGAHAFNRADAIGDQLLFRPLLYVLLGVERWAWGYRFPLWQGTSLLLHLAVVLALHRSLWTMLPRLPWLVFALAAFFGILRTGSEMVLWHHLSGYLLFCLLVVLGAESTRQFLLTQRTHHGWFAFTAALLSAFCHELGSAFALAMAAWVLLADGISARRRVLALGFAFVPVAYLAWSIADYLLRFGPPQAGGAALSADMLAGLGYTIAWWSWTALVPAGFSLWPGQRIWASAMPDLGFAVVYLNAVVTLTGLVAFLACIARSLRTADTGLRPHAVPAALFLALALTYAALVAVGRGAERGYMQTVLDNAYYPYMFVLFGILALAHLLAGTRNAWTGLQAAPVVLALGLCVAISAERGLDLQSRLRFDDGEERARFVSRLRSLHEAHGTEPDFSFSVEPGCTADERLDWIAPHAKAKFAVFRLSNVLFPLTSRDTGGKYRVDCRDAASPPRARARIRIIQGGDATWPEHASPASAASPSPPGAATLPA